jgi:hypothetical protein
LWRTSRGTTERAAGEDFGRRLSVEAALEVVDLTELVRRHIDVDVLAWDTEIAGRSPAWSSTDPRRLDLDAIAARVDLDLVTSGSISCDRETSRLTNDRNTRSDG